VLDSLNMADSTEGSEVKMVIFSGLPVQTAPARPGTPGAAPAWAEYGGSDAWLDTESGLGGTAGSGLTSPTEADGEGGTGGGWVSIESRSSTSDLEALLRCVLGAAGVPVWTLLRLPKQQASTTEPQTSTTRTPPPTAK